MICIPAASRGGLNHIFDKISPVLILFSPRSPPTPKCNQGARPKTKIKPEIQKPRNLEIQKNRKPESKEYRKMTFQLRPDQETELLLYRAKHKLKLSEMVRQALDKFLGG